MGPAGARYLTAGIAMNVRGELIVVTGGAEGIGRALCQRFHEQGARIVVVDRNGAGARAVARTLDGLAIECDVAEESQLCAVIDTVENKLGPIGLFCSNAGIADLDADRENIAATENSVWMRAWAVNVMAHVYAARALIPRFRARGAGYFLNTISAAGLLSQINASVYSTTKHAAVGFAESLAIAHWKDGIRVSILCPQGVDTSMLRSMPRGPQHLDGVMSATDVAAAAVEGLERERFLILPHVQVATYLQRKVGDYDRWIAGMVRLKERVTTAGG
jgi:NAD(P)-dependent dehydrogenase (short-subunit alcohol dehydrogenase family)